jgi:hypothetical protein
MLWLCAALGGSRIFAALPADAPVINSISVAGTNLDFVATFPAGVTGAVLKMRATLADIWQPAAALNVPVDGGTIEFTLPLPPLETAFFRLNATMPAATNNQTGGNQSSTRVSAELQFVAVPPLGPDSTNANEAVFHFKGMIDGSDRIVIRHAGALWEHVNWSWPKNGWVTVNGAQWYPSEKNFMTTTGAVAFLPEKYALLSPRLEVISGRDVVALERGDDALIVYLDDTPPGAAPYEFKIHFPLAGQHQPEISSPVATLKIAAVIDGSDLLKIMATQAEWTHRHWSYPRSVRLNDVPWDVRQTNVLANVGTNTFLPAGVDLSSAKIVKRTGRDLATMWADADALWINFADNPNGADAYELVISFGR